jgi:hypothetical protein
MRDLKTRFDDQAARLDRQAGLIQSGTRRIVRLDDWAEKIDQALETKDQQIAELYEEIRKLKQKQ